MLNLTTSPIIKPVMDATEGALPLWVYPAVTVVAMLYAAVGHGGASGYLAIFSLLSSPLESVSVGALVLNVCVATISALSFMKAGHFSWRLSLPFLAGSVPAAFLGGYLKVPLGVWSCVLALCLYFVAWRLAFLRLPDDGDDEELSQVKLPASVVSGMLIGVVSGMVGIGGGVFLTPLLVLCRWSTTKVAAGVSAVFIVVNSLAGLAGRALSGTLALGPVGSVLPFGIAGGLAGALIGSIWLPPKILRRVLAFVLVLAGSKLLLTVFKH